MLLPERSKYGNGSHVRPHQAGDEGHGQQGGDHRKGC